MSRTRVVTWRLEDQKDGTFDVWEGRKRRKVGIDYISAVRYVRDNAGSDAKVSRVEPDGYHYDITATVIR